MREIKFRAWDGEEMVIDIAIHPEWDWGVFSDNDEMSERSRSDKWILMQYTGLKDKNGKEIYEGDIVCHVYDVAVETIDGYTRYEPEGEIWEVQIRDLESGIVLCNDIKGECSSEHASGDFSVTECEIIGNIYENPELLESKVLET